MRYTSMTATRGGHSSVGTMQEGNRRRVADSAPVTGVKTVRCPRCRAGRWPRGSGALPRLGMERCAKEVWRRAGKSFIDAEPRC